MELKDFIKTVLIDICSGVNEARLTITDSAIAPYDVDEKVVDNGQLINFEISVTVSDALEGKGEGKIQVLPIGASAAAKISKETTNFNKIAFQVPIYFSAKFKNR